MKMQHINSGKTNSLKPIMKLLPIMVAFVFLAGCDYFNDNKDDLKRFMREADEAAQNANEQNKQLAERIRQLEQKNEKVCRDVSRMDEAIDGIAKELERFEAQDVTSYITKDEFDYEDMRSMVARITNHLWRVNRKGRKETANTAKEIRKKCRICQGKGSVSESCNEPEFIRCTGCGGCGMIYQDTSKCRGTIRNYNGYISTFSNGWKSSANSRPCPMCVNKKTLNNAGTGMIKNPNYRKAKIRTCSHCDGTGYEE